MCEELGQKLAARDAMIVAYTNRRGAFAVVVKTKPSIARRREGSAHAMTFEAAVSKAFERFDLNVVEDNARCADDRR